jgi:hypothetical protein
VRPGRERRREKGDRRRETGEGRQEKGDRRRETGEGRQEKGDRRRETRERKRGSALGLVRRGQYRGQLHWRKR